MVLSEVSRKREVIGAVFGKITDFLWKMDASPAPQPSLPLWVQQGMKKNTCPALLFLQHTDPAVFSADDRTRAQGQGPQKVAATTLPLFQRHL